MNKTIIFLGLWLALLTGCDSPAGNESAGTATPVPPTATQHAEATAVPPAPKLPPTPTATIPPLISADTTPHLNTLEPTPTNASTSTDDVLARLETLQANYEATVANHDGWLYVRYADHFPASMRGNTEPVNFFWLADTWIWENWYRLDGDSIPQHVIHIFDEEGGIWQRQLIADGWTAWVLPTETLEDRVEFLNQPSTGIQTVVAPDGLLKLLQQGWQFEVASWEDGGLYAITLYQTHEEPQEIVGLSEPVQATRQQHVFEIERGILQRQQAMALLSSGEWQLMYELNVTEFELLTQLPNLAAQTLREGEALIATHR